MQIPELIGMQIPEIAGCRFLSFLQVGTRHADSRDSRHADS